MRNVKQLPELSPTFGKELIDVRGWQEHLIVQPCQTYGNLLGQHFTSLRIRSWALSRLGNERKECKKNEKVPRRSLVI